MGVCMHVNIYYNNEIVNIVFLVYFTAKELTNMYIYVHVLVFCFFCFFAWSIFSSNSVIYTIWLLYSSGFPFRNIEMEIYLFSL